MLVDGVMHGLIRAVVRRGRVIRLVTERVGC